MKSVKFKTLAITALFSLAVVSCNKKEDPDPIEEHPAEMGFTFKHVVGIDPLVLGTNNQYFNELNEQFQVTLFNYYVTNVKLIKSDATTYDEPESYHLVKESDAASKHFHMEDIPHGTYTGFEFLVGVDEARNTSGAQTGALDPANDMFWSWTTGYIMAKLEGVSSSSTQADNKFRYHIGGFTGANSGIRKITLTFAQPLVIESGSVGEVEVKTDVKKWFGSDVSIAAASDVMMVGATSRKIADNYATMFTVNSSSVESQH